jgi:hypothetical protein
VRQHRQNPVEHRKVPTPIGYPTGTEAAKVLLM